MTFRSVLSVLLIGACAVPLRAQIPAAVAPGTTVTLTLDEALALAKRNNPTYLQSQTARSRSAAQLRSAYGAFIPSISTGFDIGFREGRQQFFAGVPFGSNSNVLSSSASLNSSLSISAGSLFGLRGQQKTYEAADRDVDAAYLTLRLNVTQQYMTVLQSAARVVLQDTLLGNARAQLDLASARAKAGQVTELDVRRAEVQVGQQEVASLQARNTNEVDLLRLFQLLGVTQPERVLPVTNLPVTLPTDALAPLLDQALKTSPAATAQRLREDAAGRTLSAIRGSYLPTLNLSASVSGQTQKLAGVDTGGFPFGLNRQPYNLSAGLSFPVLNGFQREQNVAVASANRRDAEYNTRALELRLTADVTAAYRTLLADYQTVQIQLKNVVAARQALDLAEQRYRLGLASLVDLVQSRADYERAANDQINATYTFHRDYAALEGAVGRPLR